MMLFGFILACTMLVLAESARFGYASNPYSRVPTSNKRDLASLGFNDLSEESLPKSLSLKSIGAALKPLQGYFSVGVAVLALLKLAQERGLLSTNVLFPSFAAQTAEVKPEEDPVIQLKKDQDEIWSAILNIHNTQKDNKESIKTTTESITTLQEAQTKFAEQYQKKVEEISSRLSDIDQSILELSQNVLDLTQSVDTKEIREQLTKVEDQLQRESTATEANIRQVREELPKLMQKHDDMVTEKLGRFKDDVTQILTKRHTKNKEVTRTATSTVQGKKTK